MKKMKLDLDALVVESFAALPDPAALSKGTIHAHEPTDVYQDCATMNTGCCTQADDVGCSGEPGCGGLNSQQCFSAGYDCTWHAQMTCQSNAIAYPTAVCAGCPPESANC